MDLYDKYFKEQPDTSIKFMGEKLVFVIPKYYFEKKVASFIGRTVEVLGIFEAFIFDDPDEENFNKAKKCVFKLPVFFLTTPTDIQEKTINVEDTELETVEKVKLYVLTFYQGDTCVNGTVVAELLPTMRKYAEMLFGAQLPATLSYREILEVWIQCNDLNGSAGLGVTYPLLASIVGELIRDPKDLSRPFRRSLPKTDKIANIPHNGKTVRLMDLPRYISSFAAVSSADAKHGITVSSTRTYNNKKEPISPVEEAIS